MNRTLHNKGVEEDALYEEALLRNPTWAELQYGLKTHFKDIKYFKKWF